MVFLFLNFGLKCAQLTAIRLSDVCDEAFGIKDTLVVDQRILEISDACRVFLEAWVSRHQKKADLSTRLFFSRQKNETGGLGRCIVRRLISGVLRDAGIPDTNPFLVLRRTAAWNKYIELKGDHAALSEWFGRAHGLATIQLLWQDGKPEPKFDVLRSGDDLQDRELMGEFESENVELTEQSRILDDENRRLKAENLFLRARIEMLEEANRDIRKSKTVEHPTCMADVAAWVSAMFSEQIILHGAAIESLEDSPFSDVADVCDTFGLLAGSFFSHYTGADWRTVETALASTRIYFQHKTSDSTTSNCAGYTRLFDGRKWTLSKHLCLGSSRDPKRCFRLYFDWDAASGKIIVFHAGRHLDTRDT